MNKLIFLNLTIVTSLYFFMLGFPLAIALFLCEKDVKEMFKENKGVNQKLIESIF